MFITELAARGEENMANQQPVNDMSDIVQNISTFDGYSTENDETKQFYRRSSKNNQYFIFMSLDGKLTFTPARFSSYKNNSRDKYDPKAKIQDELITKIVQHDFVDETRDEYAEIDKAFRAHINAGGLERTKGEAEKPPRYWVADGIAHSSRVLEPNYETDANAEIERQRHLGKVAARPGQKRFSKTIRENYGGKCAVTGCSMGRR
jgi:hypothetical protein